MESTSVNNPTAALHKQYMRNQKAIKQAKGMIYAASPTGISQIKGSVADSPGNIGALLKNSPKNGIIQLDRNLENERDRTWAPGSKNLFSDGVNG